MAAETPQSSWHPAFMPDHGPVSAPDSSTVAATTTAAATHGSLPASPDSLHNGTPLEPEPNSLDLALDTHDHGDGGAWLSSEQPTDADAQPDEPAASASNRPSAPKSAAQHSSSMSFARTVSHEISFGDDDEGEWTLSRTNTDPFKFMPPSDRTNSFPVVPPMASSPEHQSEHPLQSNQALDVLEEAERDEPAADTQNESDQQEFLESGAAPVQRSHSLSIGGDVQGAEGQAYDARYEEGVPLISHDQNTANKSQNHTSSDPFGAEDGNDDFFSQIQGSTTQTENEIEGKPRLERKSTAQVLGGLGADSPTARTALDASIAEEEPSHRDTGNAAPLDEKQPGNQTTGLDAKWEEAFGDADEDFLLDDSAPQGENIDPATFLGSDDEGLLDDVEEEPMASQPSSQPISRQASGSNPYAPQNAFQSPAPGYMPTPSPSAQGSPSYFFNPAAPNTFNSLSSSGVVAQDDSSKAQSFANKSKGGYASPYDLPTDLVNSVPKPRKRPSAQQLRGPAPATQPTPPPTRSASMYTTGIPQSNSRPPSSHGSQAPTSVAPKSSTPSLRNKSSFFEELPMSSKARPASRQSNRAQSPAQYAPPPGVSPSLPPTVKPAVPPPVPEVADPVTSNQSSPEIPNLVAPAKVSPYASLQNAAPPLPPSSSASSRYSPAPTQTGGSAPPAPGRYSAPPPINRQHSSYSPTGGASILPHQPRTSSPLAHFEITNDKSHGNSQGAGHEFSLSERRSSSSSHEPRLNRVPSLPPTREVEEEDDQPLSGNAISESRYSPAPPPARQTPPPPTSYAGQPTLSPSRKSSNYTPSNQPGLSSPKRVQSYTPNIAVDPTSPRRVSESAPRPASTHSQVPSNPPKPTLPVPAPRGHVRGPSLTMNMVPPTDGREQDPLQRWKGVPVFTWGIGGTVVKSFPKSTPRYAMSSSTPTISRTPGEVQVKNIKDINPLHERLSKFPGPLKGKSKKREVLAWLSSGIEMLENELPETSVHAEDPLPDKRRIERLLLWKILHIFVEFDGKLEGSDAIEKAVREVLFKDSSAAPANGGLFPGDPRLGAQATPVTAMQADGADAAAMEHIRNSLIQGDREAAVWSAADKRMWGHAMLIAQTVSPQLYKQVAQEFVRKEVNYPGHNNESMGALYKILSGNYDDCVDELVPSHARAGLQLISTQIASGPAKGATDGLDKWRETLTLVLSNRSVDDVRGLNALGNLLASYGRAEAAHICFMFSRTVSIFGGLDEPGVNFVLIGSDHHSQASQFAKDTEALQLSEVYEYGLSLSGGVTAAGGAPHLAAYKLQHAITLAEYGYRDKALQYCDAIEAAMTSQTKRSPYYNMILASTVEEFMIRLKQAPKEESNSWISKPSMNKVSDSMWNRFNKFVAGDENDSTSPGGAGDADAGPFGRIATTPIVSRSPSTANFDGYGGSPYAPQGVPSSAGASKYAPAAGQQPVSSNPYESSPYSPAVNASASFSPVEYPGAGFNSGPAPAQGSGISQLINNANGYAPPDYGNQSASLPYSPSHATAPALSQPGAQEPSFGYSGTVSDPNFGYSAPQMHNASTEPANEDIGAAADATSGGYEAPSYQPYGYEPPSYEPEPAGEDDDVQLKPKRSFMDDDFDNGPAPKPSERSKSEKDRENEEMFRKAAEEDAKRAAAQQGAKKGWGFSNWFGGKKPDSPGPGDASPNKPVRAKLGEASSFVYDPDLKRWVNKKPGAEVVEAKTATPPPPRAAPRSVSGTPPPGAPRTPPPPMASSAPPPRSIPTPEPRFGLAKAPSQESLGVPLAPSMSRSVSRDSTTGPPNGPPSAPPSRPTTSMSNASSIDDLLSASAPRKPGQKKARKSGRYVDVMAKN